MSEREASPKIILGRTPFLEQWGVDPGPWMKYVISQPSLFDFAEYSKNAASLFKLILEELGKFDGIG